MPTEAELSLVTRALSGDRAAFDALVRQLGNLTYARLYLETGDAHRTEDLVQETWLRAYRCLAQLKKPELLRSWLLSIVQNVLIDEFRQHGRKKRLAPPQIDMDVLLNQPSAGLTPPESATRAEDREQVLDALRGLPEEYRLPLTLRYLFEADAEEIQQQLGLTNGSLRGLLHRGLKMLRARLGPGFGE